MKDLIIAGAGGFGREAYYLAQRINEVQPTWNIKGFINDKLDALEGTKCDLPILGTIADWVPSENELFVVGISSPKGKEKVYNLLQSKGAKFGILISPTAIVNPTAVIGEGSIVTGHSSIGEGANIGKCVHVAGSMVGSRAEIGDFSTTTGYANITNAKLGRRVFIGSHAVILNNLHIGDDAFVCAGSIVFSNVKSNIKVFGNPAKKFEL